MAPIDVVRNALLARGGKHSGNNWTCPAHDDETPSLSVGEGEDGRVLLKCHAAECPPEAVVAALGLPMTALFPDEGKVKKEIVETYPYEDEDGRLLYEVVRFEPKDFRQRRPGGQPPGDGWIWNLKGVTRVLYRLPQVLDAISMGETIYVCEGEKDVAALEKAGVVATCNAGGAGKWDASFTKILANADYVVLWADNDEPGLAHMKRIRAELNGTPNRIVVGSGKDPHEHLVDMGMSVETVADVVEGGAVDEAPPSEPAAEPEPIKPRIVSKNAASFAAERVSWLHGYEGLIPVGMVTMLAGLPGLGKSMLVCLIAAMETQLGHRVCIAAAEDSINHVLVPRLQAAGAVMKLVEFLSYEDEHGEGPIQLPDHGNILRDEVIKMAPSFLAVDPIGSFMGRAVDSWKATDVRAALGPFKSIAELVQCAVFLVAHLNKGTGAYLDRVSDSAAFGQLVRSGLMFGRDPSDPDLEAGDRRVLVSGKLNVGLRPSARNYSIRTAWVPDPLDPVHDISTARLEYTGDSDYQTGDLLAASKVLGEPESPETAEACLMLAELLAEGPRSAADVRSASKAEGMSMKPVYNAAKRLKVEIVRAGFQKGSVWQLP